MKKIFTLVVLFMLAFNAFAQKYDPTAYDDLMRQSRKARTTSIVFVSVGPAIAAGGIGTLIYGLVTKDDGYGTTYVNGNYVINNKESNTAIVVGSVAAAAGIALALYSIHFSNKASELKREARKTKLKTSIDRINIPGMQNSFAGIQARQYKLSLVISLGR